MAGWLTPSANEDAAGNLGAAMQPMLGSQAKLAGYPTPRARDGTDSPGMATESLNPDGSKRSRLDTLPMQARPCT